jgi:hypothetical protein
MGGAGMEQARQVAAGGREEGERTLDVSEVGESRPFAGLGTCKRKTCAMTTEGARNLKKGRCSAG